MQLQYVKESKFGGEIVHGTTTWRKTSLGGTFVRRAPDEDRQGKPSYLFASEACYRRRDAK